MQRPRIVKQREVFVLQMFRQPVHKACYVFEVAVVFFFVKVIESVFAVHVKIWLDDKHRAFAYQNAVGVWIGHCVVVTFAEKYVVEVRMLV